LFVCLCFRNLVFGFSLSNWTLISMPTLGDPTHERFCVCVCVCFFSQFNSIWTLDLGTLGMGHQPTRRIKYFSVFIITIFPNSPPPLQRRSVFFWPTPMCALNILP
jgi:hypothetical protein